MKKEQFLDLCTTNPEEVFKLFCLMGEKITTLQSQVVALNEQVDVLEAEVKELKSHLDKNSSNSYKPPSTDEFVKPISQRKKSGKKPGGQKGHQGHTSKISIISTELLPIARNSAVAVAMNSFWPYPGNTNGARTSISPCPSLISPSIKSSLSAVPAAGFLNKGVFPGEKPAGSI